MDGPQGHYAKGIKSARKRQMLHGVIHMWNLKQQQKTQNYRNGE